jgi:hypothetical protein
MSFSGRRIVTGHDAEGKSVVLSDGPALEGELHLVLDDSEVRLSPGELAASGRLVGAGQILVQAPLLGHARRGRLLLARLALSLAGLAGSVVAGADAGLVRLPGGLSS